MLFFTAQLKRACKQNENLAEQVVIRVERFQDAAGVSRTRNIFGSKFCEGNVFGQFSMVTAPIDLQPGDAVDIDAADGVVIAVFRGETKMYENTALVQADENRTAARLAARKAKQKQDMLSRGITPPEDL